MRLSKHSHACLLIQENDLDILVDPGMYTKEDNSLDLSVIAKLDYIIYTHDHQDHFSIPYLQDMQEAFPEVKIIANDQIKEKLAKENIPVAESLPDFVSAEDAPHEKFMHGFQIPTNISYTLFQTLTH